MVSVKPFHSRQYARAGLSILEILGCLLGIIGGVWLGAVYLGLDLKHAAYVALAETDLLEKFPENWRPEVPADAPRKPTSAELAESVQKELLSLHGEIAALRSKEDSPHISAIDPRTTAGSEPAMSDRVSFAKRQTIAYWNRLHEVIGEQAFLQRSAESGTSGDAATKLAAMKARIHRFAARAILAIPTEDVDHLAQNLGQELADWYERAAANYEQAVMVWETPSRRADDPVAKDWEFAQIQIRNEGRLLSDKLAATRDALSRHFAHEFPDIGSP
jgi:hypothetical protein